MSERTDDLTGACLIIGEPSGAFADGFNAVVAPALANVLSYPPDRVGATLSWVSPSALLNADNRRREVLSALAHARLAVFDVSAGAKQDEILYLLGAREALASGVTLACSMGPKPDWSMSLCTPRFIQLDAASAPAEAEQALRGLVDPRLREYASDFRRADVVQVSPTTTEARLAPGEAERYAVPGGPKGAPFATRLGVKCGDIGHVKDVDVWVNSENDRMQMARETDRSISARIRFLGANWTGLTGEESDDAIAVALARAMGARPKLKIGDVLMTASPPETALRTVHNVLAVAHVAAVTPGGAGLGYKPGGHVGLCVKNALSETLKFARANRLNVKSILMPLIGTGDGGAAPELVASQMAGAAVDWLEEKGGGGFETIYFLAFSDRNKAAVLHAFEAHGCTPEPAATVSR